MAIDHKYEGDDCFDENDGSEFDAPYDYEGPEDDFVDSMYEARTECDYPSDFLDGEFW